MSGTTSATLTEGVPADEGAAIVALLRAQLVTPFALSSILELTGSAVRLVRLSEEDRLFRPDRKTHEFIGAVTESDISRAKSDVQYWEARGYSWYTVLDEDYPGALRSIFNRPPFVFIAGEWSDERFGRGIAIVGTRRASDAGLRRAARLSRELAEAGFVIYSGMAKGIDTAAHTAALESDSPTVAVMGTGIERRYPKENAGLAEQILRSGGALVSQFFPAQPPTTWSFPNRNIVMSGLTLATAVVEASETSGARMQARVALQHGRTVFLLRSLVDEHAWARRYVDIGAYGTHAIAISSTADILDRLNEPEDSVKLTA